MVWNFCEYTLHTLTYDQRTQNKSCRSLTNYPRCTMRCTPCKDRFCKDFKIEAKNERYMEYGCYNLLYSPVYGIFFRLMWIMLLEWRFGWNFLHVLSTLIVFGCRQCTYLFAWHSSTSLTYVLVYVNNIIITGSSHAAIYMLIQQLNARFSLKDLGQLNYFLGVKTAYIETSMHLNQQWYIHDLLYCTRMANCKPISSPYVLEDNFLVKVVFFWLMFYYISVLLVLFNIS